MTFLLTLYKNCETMGSMKNKNKYGDSFDPDEQVTAEETIAATIFDSTGIACSEEKAGSLGRKILKKILKQFRPDLFCRNIKTKRLFITDPHGEQTVTKLLGKEYSGNESVGNSLFMIKDTQGREIVLTGEEFTSLAKQWFSFFGQS